MCQKRSTVSFFLTPGDIVTVRDAILKFNGDKDSYTIDDMSGATLTWYDEEEDVDYEIKYAWDLQKSDENYGKPYF